MLLGVGRGSELTRPHSLHATKYPWVHGQWFKTYDHQAYVQPQAPLSRLFELTHANTGCAEVSKSTRKSARLATLSAESPTDPWSAQS